MELVVVKSGPFDSVIEFEVAGGDFLAVEAFPAGEGGTDRISIFFSISDDDIALERDEEIRFTLMNLDPSDQILIYPDTTLLTITDDDGKLLCTAKFTKLVSPSDLNLSLLERCVSHLM